MKKLFLICICLALAVTAGCTVTVAENETAETTAPISNDIAAAAVLAEDAGDYDADLRLNGAKGSITGSGASLSDGVVTISQAGEYRLAGDWNGSIVVDCKGDVTLHLCGLRVRGEGYALYARDCDSLTIQLHSEYGQSYFSQTTGAEDNGVCVESKAPVTIAGDGLLTLQAAGIGLRSSGDILLSSGELCVNSADCAVKAKGDGNITVTGGHITLQSESKGLKAAQIDITGGSAEMNCADACVDAEEFSLASGEMNVQGEGDGIQAETLTISGGTITVDVGTDALQTDEALTISGGTVTITSGGGGGSAYYEADAGGQGFGGPGGSSSATYTLPDYSCKGLKSDGSISITGGSIDLNCCDDAIHAAGDVTIDDCELKIVSNDDAIHSDTNLTINNGNIFVNDCFEGLEAGVITINGGAAEIYSVNDGINASDASGGWGSSASFSMYGGTVNIYVTGSSSNLGDGIDSNGSINIYGGHLTSSTDGSSMENGIDSGSSFVVYGGILASGGNSGMQETASTSSTQCTAVLSTAVQAGTECIITDEAGTELIRFTPYRYASCLVFSHPDFQIGSTYTLTAGTTVQSFTFESVSYSDRGGFGFGGGPGGGFGGRF